MDDQITVFVCPDCALIMGRMRQVPTSEHWTEWQCWDCGHVFGIFADHGQLDVGLIRDSRLNRNELWETP